MERQKFRQLFEAALERTRTLAEEQMGRRLPDSLQRVFHGPPVPGAVMDGESVLKELWLGEETFYRIVDLIVTGYSDTWTRVMIVVSGHQPSGFWETWNPKEFGPFKPQGAELRLWKQPPAMP